MTNLTDKRWSRLSRIIDAFLSLCIDHCEIYFNPLCLNIACNRNTICKDCSITKNTPEYKML